MTERKGWFRRFFARTKDAVTHEEVVRRLQEAERALRLQGLEKPQAEADQPRLEGAAALLEAIGDNNAVVVIGSVLLIRRASSGGPSDIFVRTLTQGELIFLEKHPHILKDPQGILDTLSSIHSVVVEPKLPPQQIGSSEIPRLTQPDTGL